MLLTAALQECVVPGVAEIRVSSRTSEKVPVNLFSNVDFPTEGNPADFYTCQTL